MLNPANALFIVDRSIRSLPRLVGVLRWGALLIGHIRLSRPFHGHHLVRNQFKRPISAVSQIVSP